MLIQHENVKGVVYKSLRLRDLLQVVPVALDVWDAYGSEPAIHTLLPLFFRLLCTLLPLFSRLLRTTRPATERRQPSDPVSAHPAADGRAAPR